MVALRSLTAIRPLLLALASAAMPALGGCAAPSERTDLDPKDAAEPNETRKDTAGNAVKKDTATSPPTEQRDTASPMVVKDTAPVIAPADTSKPADTMTVVRDTAAPMDTAPAPTWTQIYASYFGATADKTNKKLGCKGSTCHDVEHEGWIFKDKNQTWTKFDSLKFFDPMDPEGSQFWSVVTVRMPPKDYPQLTAADVARINAWIAAGAKNN